MELNQKTSDYKPDPVTITVCHGLGVSPKTALQRPELPVTQGRSLLPLRSRLITSVTSNPVMEKSTPESLCSADLSGSILVRLD